MSDEVQKNSYRYHNSRLFHGTVRSCDPGTKVIQVSPDGKQDLNMVQGIPLSHVFASTMGFKETILYNVGTRVLCQGLGGHLAIIIGALPHSELQGDTVANLPGKVVLSAGEPLMDSVHQLGYSEELTKLQILNNGLPTDAVQGEKVIANEFGVMLALFQMVAMLRASDLAQVQCHFLDDLVRIVSHNFQHYSALGEININHDGKTINYEMGATHNPYESLGSVDPSLGATVPSIVEVDPTNSTTDPSKVPNDFYQITKNARALERMKLFVGKLGGFINLLLGQPTGSPVTNPATGQLNTGVVPDMGLLQIKANLDGSLIVRSANGIYLEKTNWIRVPQRILSADDPAGDNGSTVAYQQHQAYGFDNSFVYRNTAFLYYLQLRDYLAYTNEELGYSDFKTLQKDFYVNDDYTKANAPDGTIFVDPYTQAGYQRTRSVVALMPNGGIALADNWGSCISMEGGNIYIQPAKDLVVQPGRNLVGKIGGSVAVAVNNNIDLSSTAGSLRIKTSGAQTLYSDQSGILLHANGQPSNPGIRTFGDLDNSSSTSVVGASGVVMYAPNSGVTGYGKQIYLNGTENSVLTSPYNLIHSPNDLELRSKQSLLLLADSLESITNTSTTLYSVNELTAAGLGATTLGIQKQVMGYSQAGGEVYGLLNPSSDDQNFFASLSKQNTDNLSFKTSSRLIFFNDPKQLTDIKFQYLPSNAYGLTAQDSVIPETYSQQQNALLGVGSTSWKEITINGSYPYPGADLASTSYASLTVGNVQNLNNELVNKTINLLNKSGTIQTSNVFNNYQL